MNLHSKWCGRIFSSVRIVAWFACLSLVGFGLGQADAAELKTRNVFLITADGLRWQEIFSGAEELLMNKTNGGVANADALRKKFWRDTADERRRILMPFLWSSIATRGQIFGNQAKGSVARVTNGRNFSYPGYSELLTGRVDPAIDSNDKNPNPNVTVLEWLHGQSGFKNGVAAFACWDVFPYIINHQRAGFPVRAGWDIVDAPNAARENLLTTMRDTPRVWDNVIYDSFMFSEAMEHVRATKPRLTYLAFGETDDWAHDGRYDHYLKAANYFDRAIQRLWESVQAMPEYRGTTTFVITTDHGRGNAPKEWKNHGEKVVGSEFIWLAVIGPDTPPLGERSNIGPVTQNQIAATLAALLGEDFRAAFPGAGQPIPSVLPDGNPTAPRSN